MSQVTNMVSYYEMELEQAKNEAKITGKLEKNAQELSGITANRFAQLQELEAVLKFLNIQYDKTRSMCYKKLNEGYNRTLTDRAIEKYLDGEDDVVDMHMLINEVALIRNKFLAVIKGLEYKHYQLSNIVKLRVVGLENAVLENNFR